MARDDHPATACSSKQKRFCNRAGGSARPALARSAQSAEVRRFGSTQGTKNPRDKEIFTKD